MRYGWPILLLGFSTSTTGQEALDPAATPTAVAAPATITPPTEDRLRAEVLRLRGENAALRQLLAQLQLQVAQRDRQTIEAEAAAFVASLRKARQIPEGVEYSWEQLDFLPAPPLPVSPLPP